MWEKNSKSTFKYNQLPAPFKWGLQMSLGIMLFSSSFSSSSSSSIFFFLFICVGGAVLMITNLPSKSLGQS